ncbi:hypothetical protein EI555_015019 [Monodon monoceros]|uniref:Sodium/calcium exchanger 1 n=2 Tax=Boreoeutheria TaxID=1437010 RepID=A0A4U1F206_MONMO|nr:hypothetical protein EI555_015019 [Monodon monoceros]
MVALLFSHVDRISAETEMEGEGNETGECTGSYYCKKGVILPIWEPQDPSFGDKIARATVYFVAMVYMFLGVSIIADRFMSSIEVITSQEKEITIKKPNGETTKTTVRIWNETVSNLTLMALGSSAPEILLSVIEVCGHNFTAGDLGPSTIVGSAAFNMFIIIALCVYVVPDGETRKIKHLRVFFVTAAWSIFAYTWLYIILSVISPGVVEVWEGLLTFFFFPICVVFAWVADRRLLFYKYVYKRYRAGKQRGMIIEHEGDRPSSKTEIEMDGKVVNSHVDSFLDGALVLEVDERDQDDEEARREMARILKELKQKHPEKEIEQLIELANYQVLSQQQKSRAFYRIQATRLMTGAGNILKRHAADQARKAVSMHEVNTEVAENDPVSKIFFEQGTYQCLENCGTVALTIIRRGGDLTNTVFVDFRTEDGTANAGSDYEFTEGTVVFKPGETQKEIRVGIIDDDIFEEDENFLVHLSNVKVSSEASEDGILEANHVSTLACLGSPSTATVTIFDDDHAGIFTFEEPVTHVSESIGIMEVKVLRTSGARGNVIVPYKTIEGTARGGGEDFEDTCGELEFQNDEIVFMPAGKVIQLLFSSSLILLYMIKQTLLPYRYKDGERRSERGIGIVFSVTVEDMQARDKNKQKQKSGKFHYVWEIVEADLWGLDFIVLLQHHSKNRTCKLPALHPVSPQLKQDPFEHIPTSPQTCTVDKSAVTVFVNIEIHCFFRGLGRTSHCNHCLPVLHHLYCLLTSVMGTWLCPAFCLCSVKSAMSHWVSPTLIRSWLPLACTRTMLPETMTSRVGNEGSFCYYVKMLSSLQMNSDEKKKRFLNFVSRTAAAASNWLSFQCRANVDGSLFRSLFHVVTVEFQSTTQTILCKTISVKVIDDEEYEKNKTFLLEIGEPRLVEMSEKKALLLNELGGFTITEEYDDKQPLTSKEEEERRIAEMGRPILGEHTRLEVIIEESYEFKRDFLRRVCVKLLEQFHSSIIYPPSTVDKLIKKTNLALVVGTNSWREQFIEAITVSAGEDDDDDECGEEKLPSCFDYVMHFLTVFWKVLFAFVPPTEYWNGWACFIVSILMIGLLTAFIGDLASHFGCTIGLKDSVTAVVFVALGTSVPDTFASKVAATQDQYADASIGNVTGSNAVNVFLGIGVAWSIAAIYHAANGEQFKVSPGTLAFSVTLFTIFAFINVGVLLYRRRPEIGGDFIAFVDSNTNQLHKNEPSLKISGYQFLHLSREESGSRLRKSSKNFFGLPGRIFFFFPCIGIFLPASFFKSLVSEEVPLKCKHVEKVQEALEGATVVKKKKLEELEKEACREGERKIQFEADNEGFRKRPNQT